MLVLLHCNSHLRFSTDRVYFIWDSALSSWNPSALSLSFFLIPCPPFSVSGPGESLFPVVCLNRTNKLLQTRRKLNSISPKEIILLCLLSIIPGKATSSQTHGALRTLYRPGHSDELKTSGNKCLELWTGKNTCIYLEPVVAYHFTSIALFVQSKLGICWWLLIVL